MLRKEIVKKYEMNFVNVDNGHMFDGLGEVIKQFNNTFGVNLLKPYERLIF